MEYHQSRLTRSLNSTAMEQQEATQVTEVYEKERRLICDTTFSQNELSTTGIVLAIKQ